MTIDFTCGTCQQESIPFSCINNEDFSKTMGSTEHCTEQITKNEINRLQKMSFNLFKLNLQNDNHFVN